MTGVQTCALPIYSGQADWNAIGELKQAITSVPVLGNGDIWSAEDAIRMMDQTDCDGYLKTAAVLAAYIDQSISTNTFYNPAHFPDRKVPTTLIAKNLMQAQLWGLKTFYYSLINKQGAKAPVDGPNVTDEQKMWNSLKGTGNVPITEEFDDDCEACKL